MNREEFKKHQEEKKKDGFIIHFAEFKRQTDWKDKPLFWEIYFKGKKICEQPKGDINIVELRRYYNKTFTQYSINL
jgi:hypothetical protein